MGMGSTGRIGDHNIRIDTHMTGLFLLQHGLGCHMGWAGRSYCLMGSLQMVDVIHWCLELGVPCISVYAFSIDNFKRAPEEVGSLMHLAEDKYNELARVRLGG